MKKRVLIIAPHPDDETLGTGGTMAKWAAEGHEVTVLIVSGHLPPLYPPEVYDTTVTEALRAFDILGCTRHRFLEIPATLVGNVPVHVLNSQVGEVFREVRPQIVLCAYPDRHVDHRVIFDSVMVAARPVGAGSKIEMLAAYETLSETHWNAPHIEPNFVPNWVVVSRRISRRSLRRRTAISPRFLTGRAQGPSAPSRHWPSFVARRPGSPMERRFTSFE